MVKIIQPWRGLTGCLSPRNGKTSTKTLWSMLSPHLFQIHCSLLLLPLPNQYRYARFKFESFWTEIPGYLNCVQQHWQQPVNQHHNPLLKLHIKLSRTAKGLRKWSRTLVTQGNLSMAVCREVISQLDKAEEERQLSSQEHVFRKFLKTRLLGLSAIEKARAKQKSRLTWLRKGDTNTKYFQIVANTRKRRYYIHMFNSNGRIVTTQQDKQEAVYQHFLNHFGTYKSRSCSLNFQNLKWEPRELHQLDEPFTEEEIKQAIFSTPKEKAPGPDGFIGLFYTSCWQIIKDDLMQALNHFYSLNQQELHLLNQAYIILLPKKDDPIFVSDYRPISLTHSFAKIVSKILANRLAPELPHIISINQSAFIKRRSIHDNFIYVQELIRELHRKKSMALFVKLDISKAFDSVNWPYLLEIMEYLGFGYRWRNWISSLWCTSSSCCLLNGQPGRRILHMRGVWQGDPLSPLLFLLVIEPLHMLFKVA